MRWRRNSLIILLVTTLAIFAYVRKEVFFQQAKRLLTRSLEKSFSPVQLSIEKIKPSLFYGLVLEGLEIGFPQDLDLAFSIKVGRAFVDYNLWKLLFLGSEDMQGLVVRVPRTNIDGVTIENLVFFLEEDRISFKNDPQNALKIYGEFSEAGLSLTVNLEHLNVGNFDILTNVALSLDKRFNLRDGTPRVCGRLKTYGSVLNKRPFPELSSSFEIQGEKLRILTFSLEDNYDLRGIISLASPFNVDLSLNFYQAVPNELFSQILPLEKPNFSGLFNGLIKITGPLDQPKVEGYLEVKQGHIGDLDFVSANINIKGRYPKISIVDSRILREEDSFLLEGEMDLTDLSGSPVAEGPDLEGRSPTHIKVKADKAILWQGWDITRKHKNQVHMSKSVADDLKVTFDMRDEAGASAEDYSNELGLEYKIFGDKLLRLRLKNDEGILGLERRIKF